MRRLLALLLLILFLGVACLGANDYSGDADCVALWSIENGALTTDSVGGNTLTNPGTLVYSDTTNYKEGSGSGVRTAGAGRYMYRTDTDLDAGYPLKNGDSNKKISVCFWVRATALPAVGQHLFSYSKWDSGTRSIALSMFNDSGTVRYNFIHGYNNGDSAEFLEHAGVNITTNIWYHVGVTYDDSDKSYRIRIWDDNASSATETTGNATNNINIETADQRVIATSSDNDFAGQHDEIVVFKDVLSAAEIDKIRSGTYPTGSPPASDGAQVISVIME